MSLQKLLHEGRLEKREASKQEILDLLRLASRGLDDAAVEQISLDGRFNHAYDAALALAIIPLRCAGYRTRGEGHHYIVLEVLPEIMGKEVSPTAQYLQTCRKIRNLSTYSRSGIVSRGEVAELIARIQEFDSVVRHWLRVNHPEYS